MELTGQAESGFIKLQSEPLHPAVSGAQVDRPAPYNLRDS